MSTKVDLEKTNALNAPAVCPCIAWARDADDKMREHHPRCPQGNVVGLYVAILQVRRRRDREELLRQFVLENFPTAYKVLTEGR